MFVYTTSLAKTGKEYVKAAVYNRTFYLWNDGGEKVPVGKVNIFGNWEGNFQFRLRSPYWVNIQVPGAIPTCNFNYRSYGSAQEISCEKLYKKLQELLESDVLC